MADDFQGRQCYSEREVHALLSRAIALQKSAGQAETLALSSGSGLSLAEVAQIAAEVGIEPHHLQAAADEMERGGLPSRRVQLLGGPTAIELQHVVDGEVTEEQWESMVPEIRRALGMVGQTGQLGRSFEWTFDDRGQAAHVSARPHRGQTRIAIRSQPFYWFLVYVPGLFPALVGLGLILNQHLAPLLEWAMSGGFLAGWLGLERALFSRLTRRHERALRTLVDRLGAIVREPAPAEVEEPVSARRPIASGEAVAGEQVVVSESS